MKQANKIKAKHMLTRFQAAEMPLPKAASAVPIVEAVPMNSDISKTPMTNTPMSRPPVMNREVVLVNFLVHRLNSTVRKT